MNSKFCGGVFKVVLKADEVERVASVGMKKGLLRLLSFRSLWPAMMAMMH